MATYKVIQDIEAEDKFLGPLTLKQFIFASIAAILIYISFWTLTKGVWVITVIFLPFIASLGFLAFPWGREQPTEIWLLAKIRFMLKPRRRIWDQTGQAELVTITAPKKVEGPRIDNLTQTEVKSRLSALANMLDSRGWAVKNVNVNMLAHPAQLSAGSDRLVAPSALPREVPATDIVASDDILDPQNNPTAAHLDQMISASTATHKQQTIERVKQIASGHEEAKPDYWFMNQPAGSQLPGAGMTGFGTHMVTADDSAQDVQITDEEKKIIEKAKTEHHASAYGHTKVLRPGKTHKAKKSKPAVPPPPDPAILGLANNDDLNVATIARQAKREIEKQTGSDEVVVSLR